MERHGKNNGTDQILVDPRAHNKERLVLAETVESVEHFNRHKNRKRHGGSVIGDLVRKHLAVDDVTEKIGAVVEVGG